MCLTHVNARRHTSAERFPMAEQVPRAWQRLHATTCHTRDGSKGHMLSGSFRRSTVNAHPLQCQTLSHLTSRLLDSSLVLAGPCWRSCPNKCEAVPTMPHSPAGRRGTISNMGITLTHQLRVLQIRWKCPNIGFPGHVQEHTCLTACEVVCASLA